MELSELPLALIREYSRPRVSKEGREEYRRYVKLHGPSPAVLRAMVTPRGIEVVRGWNGDSEVIEEQLRHYLYTPFSTTKAATLRRIAAELKAEFEAEIKK
jgi:hypothetical protein